MILITTENQKLIAGLHEQLRMETVRWFEKIEPENQKVWEEPYLQTQLIKVIVASPFSAQTFLIKPNLMNPSFLGSAFNKKQLQQELAHAVAMVKGEVSLHDTLRQFRNAHQVRLIWRNRCGLCETQNLVEELSHLADVCVDEALSWLHQDSVKQWGQPTDAQGTPQYLVVLGMGKLGGKELNLSSDIDLIFSYNEAGVTEGAKRSIDNQQFFIRLGQRLIKALDAISAQGFVFRVDMRLRPYGASGALCLSFDAMEIYYQQQGREWERYALIKARVIAGDLDQGAKLLELLRPFIYRKYLDFGAIESLRSLKKMIASEVRRRGLQQNVKLGAGGIREVEFIAQAFQLIRGGRDLRLRTNQLMEVLSVLPKTLDLTEAEAQSLRQHYWFLRDVEHALQAVNDQQTQDLPKSPVEQERIAFALNFDTWHALQANIDQSRKFIHQQFDLVVAQKQPHEPLEQEDPLAELWNEIVHLASQTDQYQPHPEWSAVLVEQGFEETDLLLGQLWSLQVSRTAQMMQPIAQERLAKLMPQVLFLAAQQENKTVTIARVLVLIEAVLRRSAYLALLLENPSALKLLVELCAASPWFADFLARQPSLLDELLDVNSLFSVPDAMALKMELEQSLLRIPEEDAEQIMEALRHFKHAHLLRIAAQEVTGRLPLMRVSDQLTYVAEAIVGQVKNLAWRQLSERHGQPQNEQGACDDFIVVGYGKVGGWELSYGSDLDLVFVYDMPSELETDGAKAVANSVFFTRLGQRMINYLNTVTASGQLYEVDMRLRPDGAKGLLVSTLTAFKRYQLNDAWTWEHQALVRARVIAGSEALAQSFYRVRRQVLGQERDQQKLKLDVVKMRTKMREQLATKSKTDDANAQFHLKHDEGGMVDIEFMVQFGVLAYAFEYPEVLTYTDNIRILEIFEQCDILTSVQAEDLRQAYQLIRATEHRLSLQNKKGQVFGQYLKEQRQRVQQIWQAFM